jgi:hypothetical protein
MTERATTTQADPLTDASPGAGSPALAEYEKRLRERQAAVAAQLQRERRLSYGRGFVALLTLLLLWLAIDRAVVSPLWVVVPVLGFVALVVMHASARRQRRRLERAAAFYERGLARLQESWAGGGETGTDFVDAHHPYAVDLDVFGAGSLFDLLCTARTRAGAETLARWLCAPAEPAVVLARQQAVDDLRPRLDLREDLAVLGDDVGPGVHAEALAAWGEAAAVFGSSFLRPVAAVLAAAVVVTLIGWLFSAFGPLPFLAAVAAEGVFAFSLRPRVLRVMRSAERPSRDLALLAELLERLERERFDAPLLQELRHALEVEGEPPSRQIRRLRRRIEILDARRNELFAPVAALLLWATQAAMAIEAWRHWSGPSLRRWLQALAELEALNSLAGYAYEHPNDPFPEITDEIPCYEGEGLGHPLIPETRCVRNDIRLHDSARVLIVSGSNMSGKSTLLRTVGTNAVLAFAGAPVRATRLRLSPLAVGASIRVHDSLREGVSHFYAEITRLRQLVDITAGPLRLLFLLDEILQGTNSHDRRIGAEAVVRELVQRGAVGLVTTHDLALARIAEVPEVHAANVHFEDRVDGGRVTFDYRMRPGVVQKSNALELMRAVGLQV